MSRTLTTKNAAEVPKQVTRPLWFIELGFGTPLKLSSRETLVVSGTTYTAAGIRVDLASGKVDLFNEAFQYSVTFLGGASGKTCTIYAAYGAAPFVSSDLDQLFDGEIGAVSAIGTVISFAIKLAPPVYTPRIVVAPPTFTHLTPATALWVTATGNASL